MIVFLSATSCLKSVYLASFTPNRGPIILNNGLTGLQIATVSPAPDQVVGFTGSPTTEQENNVVPTKSDSRTSSTQAPSTKSQPPASLDPGGDFDDSTLPTKPTPGVAKNPDQDSAGNVANGSYPLTPTGIPSSSSSQTGLELSVLFYSLFIVYVSSIKLIYHNITIIKSNLTEPGLVSQRFNN